jgi:serine/threonine protein phosphatase PrpC
MITIQSESFISEIGKREINEDGLQFQSGKFYIVCDGLGGNGNGQIASQLVAETVKESLLKSKSILEAVQEAEKVLSSYKNKHPSTEYMATTIAFTHILDKGILIIWAGDSRVYQFRDGKIIYKTKDHTLVSEALNNGVLTAVEALFHPDANELTKSIKGAQNSVELDQILLQDIKEYDYFLLCTDGIIDSFIDTDLETLFSESKSTKEIIDELDKSCQIFSNDNYSAIVFQVNFATEN